MKTYHILNVQISIILRQMNGLYQNEVGWFFHSIDNHSYWIMLFVILWQACDEIHINHLQLPFCKFYILSQTSKPLVFYFHVLAIWAFGNKLSNALLHVFLPIYFSYVVVHLSGTPMNITYRSMSLLNDPPLEYIHPRYIKPTLILQHTIFPLFKSWHSLLMNIRL